MNQTHKNGPRQDEGDRVLRVSYIWCGDVMSDIVVQPPDSVTLGCTGTDTLLIPDIGIPDGFELFRSDPRGYVMTLGIDMGGELELDGQKHKVKEFVQASANHYETGFRGTTIGAGDCGVIELDASGEHALFFQFVTRGPAIPHGPLLRDAELMLPAFAFSMVLVGFFLTYALVFFEYEGPSFLWPNRKELVANYFLNRRALVFNEEKKVLVIPNVKAGTETGDLEIKPVSSNGAGAKSGGEGDKERKRAETPDKGEPDQPLPLRIQTGLLNDQSRKAMDKIRNRGSFDEKLGNLVARLSGPANGGGIKGRGNGEGTGIGSGRGTGTLSQGAAVNTGGGGTAHADIRTQGELNTGGKRTARGTPGGDSVEEAPVKVTPGNASGTFGGLTAAQIKKVVTKRARAIAACYQRELQRSPGLSGKVVMGWKINSDGKVDRAKVRSTTLKNGRVEDCIIREVNNMAFPSPKYGGSAVVTFPFVFAKN